MTIHQLKENIHRERRFRNIKVSDLCKNIGKDRFYISQMINPPFNTIIDIANAIGCTPADLMKE